VDELGDITVKFPGRKSLVYNPSCVVKDDDQSPFLMEEELSYNIVSSTPHLNGIQTHNFSGVRH
jgi:hypothetical protein